MTVNSVWEFASYPGLVGKLLRENREARPAPVRMAFGPGKDQYFLHFAPEEPRSDLVVLYLHGGGWNSGSPDFFAFIGRRLAREGYHAILPGYRKAPKYPFPAQAEDVCAGFRRALFYLERRGIPARRAAVIGSSAGGQLGALLCYDRALQRRWGIHPEIFAGFAGLGGPYRFDLDPTYALKTLSAQLVGSGEAAEAQPWYKLGPDSPKTPMLLIQGLRDSVVRYQTGLSFYRKAEALGIPAQFYAPPDRADSHSVYSAGCFLEARETCPTVDRLLEWLEGLG